MDHIFRVDVDHRLDYLIQKLFYFKFIKQPLFNDNVFEAVIRTKLQKNVDIVFVLKSMWKINNVGMVELLVNQQLIEQLHYKYSYLNSISIVFGDDFGSKKLVRL